MKVYALWDDMAGELIGVYSTRAKAEAARAKRIRDYHEDEFGWLIEERELQ